MQQHSLLPRWGVPVGTQACCVHAYFCGCTSHKHCLLLPHARCRVRDDEEARRKLKRRKRRQREKTAKKGAAPAGGEASDSEAEDEADGLRATDELEGYLVSCLWVHAVDGRERVGAV